MSPARATTRRPPRAARTAARRRYGEAGRSWRTGPGGTRPRGSGPRGAWSAGRGPWRSQRDSQVTPHHIHLGLRRLVHHDPVRPLAGEAFFLPFARRVDAHLGAVGEPTARMIEH